MIGDDSALSVKLQVQEVAIRWNLLQPGGISTK